MAKPLIIWRRRLPFLLLLAGLVRPAHAQSPAPVLQVPADKATLVSLSATLSWTWRDEFLVNGHFEQPITNGWRIGGTKPDIWSLQDGTPLFNGQPTISGKKVAITDFTHVRNGYGLMIQELSIPADATGVELSWWESLLPSPPRVTPPYPRLRVSLLDKNTAQLIALLQESRGDEDAFRFFNWARRVVDLSSYAGQEMLLAVQAANDSKLPAEGGNFVAAVDAFSVRAERAQLPQFELYFGPAPVLGPESRIGRLQALSWEAKDLMGSTTYYWRVGTVGNTTTNFSRVFSFMTEPPLSPTLIVTSVTAQEMWISFLTRADRFYAIEQAEMPAGNWTELQPAFGGNGSFKSFLLPFGDFDRRFVRVRVSQ